MSENENPIDTMTDSDFGYHVESMDAETAKTTAQNYITAAGPDSAYSSQHHPQHQRTVTRVQQLFTQSHVDDPDGTQFDSDGQELQGKVSPEMLRIEAEAKAEQEKRQNALMEEAENIMSELVQHGFNDDSGKIDANIKSHEVRCLKLQFLHAQKSEDFIPALENELRTLKDYETLSLVQGFQGTELIDEEVMSGVLENLIVKINSKHKEKGSL